MTFNRNRFCLIGILLLLLGLQFRLVHSVVLNETSTKALSKITKNTQLASQDAATNLFMSTVETPKARIETPRWLGWILMTAGGISFLHALALPPAGKD